MCMMYVMDVYWSNYLGICSAVQALNTEEVQQGIFNLNWLLVRVDSK